MMRYALFGDWSASAICIGQLARITTHEASEWLGLLPGRGQGFQPEHITYTLADAACLSVAAIYSFLENQISQAQVYGQEHALRYTYINMHV